jgi:hypothetical protein
MGTYDDGGPSAVGSDDLNGHAPEQNGDEQLSLRLEIVLVAGREGEKLQAIQARAIREALLWAAQREDSGNSLGEGRNDGHDE